MTSATAKYHDMLNSVREFMKLHEVKYLSIVADSTLEMIRVSKVMKYFSIISS